MRSTNTVSTNMLLLRGVMMRMTTLTMIIWSWGMMEKRGYRFAHDEKPLTHSLLSFSPYTLPYLATLCCCTLCVACFARAVPSFAAVVAHFCLNFYLFPGVGRSHAGNDDSDIAARVVCGVSPYMLTAESNDQEAAPTMVLSRARGGDTLGKERGWW